MSWIVRPRAVVLVALLGALALFAFARAAQAAAPPIVFGIYPGGAAGTVGADGITRPEVPALRRRALLALRPAGRPFVLHFYDEYREPSDAGDASWLTSQIAAYGRDGFTVELVLPYRPANPLGDVPGYLNFVRARVRQLAPYRALTHLQITNEANVAGAPNASDGAYLGSLDALVMGVVAAKDEARAAGSTLQIGFNWANASGPAEDAFFSSLWERGGDAFVSSVDWVGVDAYPGTWGPRLPAGRLATAVSTAMRRTMRRLRTVLMPEAHLGGARIHFSESGYPTGPGRTAAMQRTVMRSAVRTVTRYRAQYGVTDFRWFDLRDADSASKSFESQYGLTRDDYSPKPAFFAFRSLIARLR